MHVRLFEGTFASEGLGASSYEPGRPGWLGYRDLGCKNPYEHPSPDTGTVRDETFSTTHDL